MYPFSNKVVSKPRSFVSQLPKHTQIETNVAGKHGSKLSSPVHVLALVDGDFAIVILDSIGFGLVVQLLRRGFVGLFLNPGAVLDGCLQHTIRATDVHGMEAPHLGPFAVIVGLQRVEGFKSRRLETVDRGVNTDLSAIRSEVTWLAPRKQAG